MHVQGQEQSKCEALAAEAQRMKTEVDRGPCGTECKNNVKAM